MNREKTCLTLFGKHLRHLRKERHWAQEELCFRAGLNRSHVAQLEGGYRHPSNGTVQRLASALDINAEQLLQVAQQSRRTLEYSGVNLAQERKLQRQIIRGHQRRNLKHNEPTIPLRFTVPRSVAKWLVASAQAENGSLSGVGCAILAQAYQSSEEESAGISPKG